MEKIFSHVWIITMSDSILQDILSVVKREKGNCITNGLNYKNLPDIVIS